MHEKEKENKETTGKKGHFYKVLLDRAPWQDAYVFPRAMGKSERRSSAHLFWWVLCFLIVKKVLNTKEKEAHKGEKSLCWLVAFTLGKEFKPLLSVFSFQKKKKASFSFNYMQGCKNKLVEQKGD